MEEFAGRVGLHLVTRIAVPALSYVGRQALTAVTPIGPVTGTALGIAGYAGLIVVAVRPEETFDFILSGLSKTASTAGSILNLMADQLRRLEKVDLEAWINKPVQYFFPTSEEEKKQGMIAPPPPLLPKD